ncbi:lipase chaperone [Streptomyces sp. NRRL B-24572]|uniref:lipase chaperone n=1 Tax=Streptomyces sp. NRRL B-24572 TaxID=1962156 RepID=UPI000A3A6A91|nr:lipase chaperone [Streptomyces sp. NRRL B-24572]
MRRARIGLQVSLIVGAVVLSAPSALAAAEDPEVRITPQNAAPGTTVTVSTTACGKETYGKGESEAGGKFHLLPGDRKGVLVGEFVVPDDASGTDTITLKCPPRIKKTVTYRISGRPHGGVEAGFGWAARAVGSAGTAVASRPAGTAAAPAGTAAVAAAGSAATAAEAGTDSLRVPLAAGGGLLLAGAVAGGAVRLRRRARGARTPA